MTTTLDRAPGFQVAWAARAQEWAREGREADWALARRRAAAQTLSELAFPSSADELWRRTDFRALQVELPQLDPFARAPRARNLDDLPVPLLERLGSEEGPVALVAQRDAAVVLEQTHPELERQGVVVCSMDRAFREHRERIEARYESLLAASYDWYAAAGAALRGGGAFVWVPDGIEAAVPIRLFQWIDGPGRLVASRNLIVLGKGARATVVEEQLSAETEGTSLHLGGTEAFLGEESRLVFGTLQDWGHNVTHYSNQRAQVGRDAELQWIQTVLGGRSTKTNSYFDLAGPGAQAFVHGFMFGDRQQHFHLHTLQRHILDHTTSDLLIKCALRDKARSVYQGLIQVSEGAQRTDAYQANRNLLLSGQARADSIPGLEILANDVRCTHGATIGQVDEEQIFYLMARGLERSEAQRLVVEGFFAPVLDRIPLVSVRRRLQDAIERKIA